MRRKSSRDSQTEVGPAKRSPIFSTGVVLCIVAQLLMPSPLASQCLPAPSATETVPCSGLIECGPRVISCLCNEAGNVVLEDEDRNGDGTADTRIQLNYSDGNLILREIDRGVDGFVDERHVWEYEDGVLQAYEIDRDGDCGVDSRTSYFADEYGLIVQEDSDTDGDGVVEERVIFAYDGGNRVARVVDIGADGTIERECDYDPPCPPPYSWEDCSHYIYCHDTPPPLPEPVSRPVREMPAGPPDNIYVATVDELTDESSELRSSAHTLVMFSVDEEAAGWRCQPCEILHSYFSWRAGSTLRLGIGNPGLRYVLISIDPSELDRRPAFLARDIEGWPTIVHLVADQPTEILEDRLRGLNIGGLRDLVRSLEAEYWSEFSR